jgi:hypothetical protein
MQRHVRHGNGDAWPDNFEEADLPAQPRLRRLMFGKLEDQIVTGIDGEGIPADINSSEHRFRQCRVEDEDRALLK